MKIIIAGGRDFNDYNFLKSSLNSISEIASGGVEIVSGCCRGADRLGEIFANERNLPIKRFPANWGLYGKKAGYLRNIEMAEYADALIAFWDGKSIGTSNMISIAKENRLLVKVINY